MFRNSFQGERLLNGTIRTKQKSFWRAAFRVTSITLAGVMVVVVSGCGSNGGPQAASASGDGAGSSSAKSSEVAVPAATAQDQGKQFFTQSCSNCHGMNGQGVPHLGADLRTSKFVAKSTDEQLVSLIERGIPANDPRNTSHIPMPPKGANPTLTKQNIHDIVFYIRQLQKEQAESK
jgi:mono/diheme cytochrome c family protein